MSKDTGKEKEAKESKVDMSSCVEMMERMMGEGGVGCGCDPSAMMTEMKDDAESETRFAEMFSTMMSMCGGKSKSEDTNTTLEKSTSG